jgi:hypothetical protein
MEVALSWFCRCSDDSKLGKIRNVSISNFIARTPCRILMTAEDWAMVEKITLRDIHLWPLRCCGAATCKADDSTLRWQSPQTVLWSATAWRRAISWLRDKDGISVFGPFVVEAWSPHNKQ